MRQKFTRAHKLRILCALQCTDECSPVRELDLLNAVRSRALDVNTARRLLEDMALETPPLLALSEDAVFLLPAGRRWLCDDAAALSDRRKDWLRWLVTTALALAAVVISLLALLRA